MDLRLPLWHSAVRIGRVGPPLAFRLTVVGLVSLFAITSLDAQTRKLELADLARQVDLSSPRIAPDGRSVVVVVSRPDYESNRFENELVRVDLETRERRILTPDRPGIRHPRWSPSGDRLAFLASGREGEDAPAQIWVLPTDGGEARQVTDAPGGVGSFEWRPDGNAIAFVARDEREERTGGKKHNRSFRVGDNDYLTTEPPMPSHIWVVSLEDGAADDDGGAARRLTEGQGGVSRFGTAGIDWSPDGRTIAFTSQPSPHDGALVRGSLELIDVETGRRRAVPPEPGFYPAPSFSPDGRHLAYSRPLGTAPFYYPHAIFVTRVSDGAPRGEPRNATAALDRTFYDALWMPDGRSILVGAHDGTRISIWVQPLDGEPQRLELGSIDPAGGFGGIDGDVGPGGLIVFVGVEPEHPEELYYLESVDARPHRLTGYNAELASRALGDVESVTWQGPDGWEEDGVLVYPPGFDPETRYPLVLVIHGGPMSASTRGFSMLPQLMAARGWAVFSPNYRGSDNRGAAYQKAIIDDAGDGPGRDVMAGLEAVKARGFVDESRIAVSGWSYGGYMTSWLIGHYHDWAAAMAGAPVTDLIDSYNLADLNVLFGYGMNGSPWTGGRLEAYREQSPISYAPDVRTPTLILCNTGDARVPITQSYKLYHALKDNDVPVEFVAYPVPGHFPADPVHQRDVYRRWIGWIADRFSDAPAAATGPDSP